MLPHAPGVQMANIPEDGVILKEESALEDEANPDKRNPHQLRDKQIEPENEFEDAKSGNRDETIAAAADGDAKKESKTDEPMEVDGTETKGGEAKING